MRGTIERWLRRVIEVGFGLVSLMALYNVPAPSAELLAGGTAPWTMALGSVTAAAALILAFKEGPAVTDSLARFARLTCRVRTQWLARVIRAGVLRQKRSTLSPLYVVLKGVSNAY